VRDTLLEMMMIMQQHQHQTVSRSVGRLRGSKLTSHLISQQHDSSMPPPPLLHPAEEATLSFSAIAQTLTHCSTPQQSNMNKKGQGEEEEEDKKLRARAPHLFFFLLLEIEPTT